MYQRRHRLSRVCLRVGRPALELRIATKRTFLGSTSPTPSGLRHWAARPRPISDKAFLALRKFRGWRREGVPSLSPQVWEAEGGEGAEPPQSPGNLLEPLSGGAGRKSGGEKGKEEEKGQPRGKFTQD